MYQRPGADGQPQGVTDILGHSFVTTGWLGLSQGTNGEPVVRGFPSWATLPGPLNLARSRRWHFFFAWIFVINGAGYALYSLVGGHLWRDLLPSRQELSTIGRSVWDHLRLRFSSGNAARQYNVLQKPSYLVVVFGLGPLIVATGLTMSPWMDAAHPQLLDVFGGRQSARTLHFVTAGAAFVVIHIVMVLLSGVWNNLRSMITGWYRLE